jgi:hypothetical protein
MNMMDLVYIAIILLFFIGCDRVLCLIDERRTERNR